PEIRCQPLSPGAYTLSNAQLNSPWPKAILAQQQLNDWQSATPPVGLLNRRDPYPDEELPATGVPLEWERWLSAQFIHTPNYGTRCSTGIFTEGDRLEIAERTFDANGNATGTVEFTLLLSEDE
ncbi:MAG: NRDE family protein, partial [Oleibacter sp.]|nr:NRDE family protein [Thalassolituus sp.]